MNPRLRRLIRPAIIVAIVIAAGIGLKLWLLPSAPAPSYVTATVARGDIEQTVIATGALEASNMISVGAQVSGRVVSLKVEVGDTVTAGQLIAEIDSLPQQNALRNAEAGLTTSRAQRSARLAALKQTELVFRRQQDMLAADATSRAEYEAAEAALVATRADVAALDAQIEQGTIQVDTAKLNLGYTKITAPIDGTVVAVVTREGQTVNANQSAPTIIKLAELSTLTIKAQISEADVVRVAAGQKVWFTILGEPERRYHAELRAVEPAPESIASESAGTSSNTSTTAIYYNGLFDVPNPEGKLRIAMTATVNIVLGDARDVLVVPASAVVAPARGTGSGPGAHPRTPRAGGDPAGRSNAAGREGGGARGPRTGAPRGSADNEDVDARGASRIVRVLDANGEVTDVAVRIGISNNILTEIREGLEEGDVVVLGQSTAAGAAATTRGGMMRRPAGF